MVFAVSTTENIIGSSIISDVNRYRNLIIFGTSSTDTTRRNLLTPIVSLSDFTTKFGATSPSLPHIRFIFANDATQQNNYFFVNCFDAGGSPTQTTHLQQGIPKLSTFLDLEASVLICPEAFTLALQADRTSIYTLLQNACVGRIEHIHFFNTAIATATKAAAITERNLYTTNNGESSLYYEFYEDLNAAFVPVALHAAILVLLNGVQNNTYEPPSGINRPAQGIKGMRNNNVIIDVTDYNDFRSNNINIVALYPRGRYAIALSRTLSTEARWININTRIAVSLTQEKLKLRLLPFTQRASDPRGERAREAEREAIAVCAEQFQDGAFTADASGREETAYRVTSTDVVTGSKRVTEIRVYARFVECVEEIIVSTYNVGSI